MYCSELYRQESFNSQIEIDTHNDTITPNNLASQPTPFIDTNPVLQTLPLSDFLKGGNATNLFAILVGSGTVISLLPLFLQFVLGPDSLHVLLGSFLGYLTFLLILITVTLGIIFMVFTCGYIFIEFYNSVWTRNYSIWNKFNSLIVLACCLISFFSLFLTLIFVWVIKAILTFDFVKSFTIIYVFLVVAVIFFITGILTVLAGTPENVSLSTNIRRIRDKIRTNCCKYLIILVLIAVLAIVIWGVLSPPTILILNYYNNTGKTIEINLSYNQSVSNNTPPILHLRQTATKVSNIGVDLAYFDCRWSTNYGHFFEINSNGSEIVTYSKEVVFSGLPKCPSDEDSVYWTYDISDYGKPKPSVLIGFTIKDNNKGNLLGNNYLNLTWKNNDNDFIEMMNST